MVGAHLVELEPVVRDCCTPRRRGDRLAQDRCGLRGDRRPAERRAHARGFDARGGKRLGLGDVRGDRSAELRSLAEADELAGAGAEHVAGVPVRRRDDRAAGGERERERAGRALLPVRVGRDEDIGCGEQVRELVDLEEAVVEHDVLGEVEVGGSAAPASGGTPRLCAARPADVCGRRRRRGRRDAPRRSPAARRASPRFPFRARAGRTSRAGTSIRCPRSRRWRTSRSGAGDRRRARHARARARSAHRAG